MPTPKGYTLIQIVLHWTVFLLVALQFIFGDSMSHAWRTFVREGTFAPSVAVISHVVFGVLVLVLVVWRLAIKARRGAPALPENEPAWMKLAAHGAHLGLYALLILMTVSGGLAWFGGQGWSADLHEEILKPLLIVLVGLHFAAALYQQYVLKSGVLTRMVRPEA